MVVFVCSRRWSSVLSVSQIFLYQLINSHLRCSSIPPKVSDGQNSMRVSYNSCVRAECLKKWGIPPDALVSVMFSEWINITYQGFSNAPCSYKRYGWLLQSNNFPSQKHPCHHISLCIFYTEAGSQSQSHHVGAHGHDEVHLSSTVATRCLLSCIVDTDQANQDSRMGGWHGWPKVHRCCSIFQ